ncbi:site-specific integrase [Sphingomonas sp. OK281]|uniref:tyrosine-type recombinase/integrase n=1 Tax=Sphingomonas sp. OK281 TaxID=1881067 RepID=UPI0008EF860B|nr:site-specific integrase [Sphingomonas sp. OK281]SFO44931.1 Site-specific recombinase XerD [Sphingomonas sp. OK281]
MTALVLRKIVNDALAEVGISFEYPSGYKLKPRTTTWFENERGFGLRHYTTGREVYVVQTRMAGRLRTVTIAPATLITQHQAMTIARRVIAYAQVGHDPATDRARIRSAPRFDDFLDEYWRRWSPKWKASTLATHGVYRRLYLDHAFTGIFIDELNEAHVSKWFAALNDETGPGAANRCLNILANMLAKAESWGYRLENTNPCRAVRPNRKRRCERFLSSAELARLGKVLAEDRASEDQLKVVVAAAITLLLLTGCRSGEVAGLQWPDVRGNRLKLRDSKTGPRTVWLGDEARAVMAALPRQKSVLWLFWNPVLRKPVLRLTNHWPSIRKRAQLTGVRLHDLRHTFASHAAMNKETLPMIGRLLGHRSTQSTSRYAHLDDVHLLEAAEEIGSVIGQMIASAGGAPISDPSMLRTSEC